MAEIRMFQHQREDRMQCPICKNHLKEEERRICDECKKNIGPFMEGKIDEYRYR